MERYIRTKYSEAAIYDTVCYSIDYAPSYKNASEEDGTFDSYRGEKSFFSVNRCGCLSPKLSMAEGSSISILKFNNDESVIPDWHVFKFGFSRKKSDDTTRLETKLYNPDVIKKLRHKKNFRKETLFVFRKEAI